MVLLATRSRVLVGWTMGPPRDNLVAPCGPVCFGMAAMRRRSGRGAAGLDSPFALDCLATPP